MSRILDFVYNHRIFVLATLWTLYGDFVVPATLAAHYSDIRVFIGLSTGLMLMCLTLIALEKAVEEVVSRFK